jgi:hypothetical protein
MLIRAELTENLKWGPCILESEGQQKFLELGKLFKVGSSTLWDV